MCTLTHGQYLLIINPLPLITMCTATPTKVARDDMNIIKSGHSGVLTMQTTGCHRTTHVIINTTVIFDCIYIPSRLLQVQTHHRREYPVVKGRAGLGRERDGRPLECPPD